MTIENSEDTAHVGVTDPAEPPALDRASSSSGPSADGAVRAEPSSSGMEAAPVAGGHDSAPPLSRKLAPPPKPKRDSGAASAPPPGSASPSGRPLGESPDLLASASALKAPIAPTISFSLDGEPSLANPMQAPAEAAPEPAPGPVAPLSQPPPMRRRSNPSIPDVGALSPRPASDPSLAPDDSGATKAISSVPRATPPRPFTDSPGPRLRSDSSPAVAEPAPLSSPPASTPPNSSAIFAMRIIAVGDAVRPKPTQEPAPEIGPDSYPPSASRLGTTVRRSSRPNMTAVAAAAATLEMPPPAHVPTDLGPSIEVDVPIDVELPSTAPAEAASSSTPLEEQKTAVMAAVSVSALDVPIDDAPIARVAPAGEAALPGFPPVSSIPSEARRPPAPPPPVELSDDEFSAEAIAKKIAAAEAAEAAEAARATAASATELAATAAPEVTQAAEAKPAPTDAEEELGREDAISMPPEELAALQAELEAKADAAKPPPPPKRAPGAGPIASAPASPVTEAAPQPAPASTPPKDPPPTPDLAAAKAAQRGKTRQPWWEDLFNEDFMRASSRVSDEHIRREVTFIEESLGVAAGGVVLDLGCGAGHHAVEFASRGYGVVGYDLSLYQLALAADVAQERSQKINFLQGDMREMAFEEMFDGVFCWNTTFGYFEEDKNLAVAQRVFKALRPGGMFLIDVLNRDFAAASAPCTVWYEGDSCVCMDDMSVDYISSRLRVKRSIILDDGRTKESLFSLRLYSLHELGKLLHEVGFRVTEASGHPATPGVFFGPNSPRIIMLAQRP